ncbi:V-type proton ATPase subunit S1-like protein [Microtus ochrogaster]|uniref:V-type proton ATPase subunit S1 n=1 Tax=Microtus ochrogaster TaxID=79684 RepID=A0A8J6G7N5_MICOH|nr:V-type proton ATPase subunit S1-like protein [Microtus ochrogaster]
MESTTASEVIKYEYHVLYSCSYQVPVLYFRASFLGRKCRIRSGHNAPERDNKAFCEASTIDVCSAFKVCFSFQLSSVFKERSDYPEWELRDGIPCILFWTKRITVKFKNQTWLDLTDEAPGQNTTVDTGNSNCNEESAMLSLKFGDAENSKDIDLRFTLTNYNKLSSQSWFSLQRVEIIFNNSVQAAFNATGIYALSSYSYRCQRVSSLRRNDALLLLGGSDNVTSLWEVTFIDFQIQGFSIKGAQFAQARDCGSSFSPAVLIGLAMSLILLLVLAYALHMLIYLRYLDRHYEFITSPVHFPPRSELDTGEEKELLGSQGAECYELRSQQICKIYI